MTTPKQLAKWREEASSFYIRTPIDPDRLGHSHYYIEGYLRAKQENEQAMKLAKYAATIFREGVVYQINGMACGVLNPNGVGYAPNIEATIKELLND